MSTKCGHDVDTDNPFAGSFPACHEEGGCKNSPLIAMGPPRPSGISDAQALVRAFQEKFFGPQPETPLTEDQVDWDEHTLRLEWMDSEHSEIETAIRRRNIADLADGYLDDLFFALGGLVRLGIDAAPLFQAIADANMAKVRIPGLAKIAKPEGWTPPDIAALIEAQRNRK